MFDYRVSQTDRGNGTAGLGVRLTYKTYWPLVVGHGACRCCTRTIVHVKSEDVGFTHFLVTHDWLIYGDCGLGSGDCWMRQADC